MVKGKNLKYIGKGVEMKIIEEQMSECRLCPRECKVNRTQGQKGICGQTDKVKVARAGLHMWEEPCISGNKGSGTVFFTGCSLHCVFCQNHRIANGETGKEITIERLVEIFLELQEKGANNINLVTAGQFVPQIVKALKRAKEKGLYIPIVYNTSAYETVETLKLLEGYVDIYLPDLKYVDKELSKRYSHAPDYFERAKAAIEEMVRQTGDMKFVKETGLVERENQGETENIDKECFKQGDTCIQQEVERQKDIYNADTIKMKKQEGMQQEVTEPESYRQKKQIDIEEYQLRSEKGEQWVMKRGVIVRHLLLPGCAEDSKKVLEYLLEQYGDRIFISILNQYTPLPHVSFCPELNRKVTEAEYEEVVDFAISLGIENGFIQEGEAAQESFIPEFDGSGV